MTININGTTGISGVNGSETTPAIQGNNDTNTGISFDTDEVNIVTGGTTRATVDSSGRLLVGTTSITGDQNDGELVLQGSTTQGELYLSRDSTPGNTGSGLGFINFTGGNGTDSAGIKAFSDGGTWTNGSSHPSRLEFSTTANGDSSPTTQMTIDSAGRLLVGTTARNNWYGSNTYTPQIQNEGNGIATSMISNTVNSNGSSGPYLVFGKTRGTTDGSNTAVQNGDTLGSIDFQGADGTYMQNAVRIRAQVDNTPGSADMPGRLVFETTADGASSTTERFRISSTSATTHTMPSTFNGFGHTANAQNTSYSSRIQVLNCYRTGSSVFYFLNCLSGNAADHEFILRGDGNAYADGSWNGGGADYAEYFEWSDGNTAEEDRRGISVVLDGDKIREAVAGEDPIGVISGNPSVVGDAAWNKWSGKHLRDDFGTYILEPHNVVSWKDADGKEHNYEDWNIPADVVVPADAVVSATDENGNAYTHRKVNPDYDPDMEYVPREDRPEWDCVGLMGKLRIRKGQVTGSRWIKMRDISDNVEEWLVR